MTEAFVKLIASASKVVSHHAYVLCEISPHGSIFLAKNIITLL